MSLNNLKELLRLSFLPYSVPRAARRNIASVYLLQFQRFFVFPLTIFYVAMHLSERDFGVFVFGITLSQLAIVVVDFGLNQRLVLIGRGRRPCLKATMNLIFLKIGVALAFLIVMLSVIDLYYSDHIFEFNLFILAGVSYSIFNFISAFYRSEVNFSVELIGVTVSNLILIGAIIFLDLIGSIYVLNLAVFFLLSRVVPMVYGLVVFLRDVEFRAHRISFMGEWANALPLALVTILAFFYLYLDLFVIEALLGYSSLAEYQIAFRVIMLTMIAPEIFNNLMLPYLSRAKREDSEKYRFLLRFSVRILFFYSVFAAITVYFFGASILQIFFEDLYVGSQSLLVMMIPLVILRSIGAPLGLALLLEGFVFARLYFMSGAALLGLIGNLLFIPLFGLQAAVGVSIFVHVVLNYAYWLRLNSLFLFKAEL